jgi:hypothetical protein
VVAKSVAAGAAAPLAIRGPLATLLLRYANSAIMPAAACSQLVKVAAHVAAHVQGWHQSAHPISDSITVATNGVTASEIL